MDSEVVRWFVFAVTAVLAVMGLVFTVIPLRIRTRAKGWFQSKRSDQAENFERADLVGTPARWLGAGFAVAALATLAVGTGAGIAVGFIVFAIALLMAYTRPM